MLVILQINVLRIRWRFKLLQIRFKAQNIPKHHPNVSIVVFMDMYAESMEMWNVYSRRHMHACKGSVRHTPGNVSSATITTKHLLCGITNMAAKGPAE